MDHHDHMGHSGMDHGGMDHGNMGHDQCNMNMLFTWDTNNLCIVFRWWRIHNWWTFIITLLAIVALGAGYELVREFTRKYEAKHARSERDRDRSPQDDPTGESSSLLWPGRGAPTSIGGNRVILGALYAAQVFYSFFIMLLFMTYNGWIMIAVAVGAFVGYLAFSNHSAVKSVACH